MFTPVDVVRYMSDIVTLRPGDLILTGTPGGVGFGMNPPVFLQPGQVVRTTIEGIGELVNECVASSLIPRLKGARAPVDSTHMDVDTEPASRDGRPRAEHAPAGRNSPGGGSRPTPASRPASWPRPSAGVVSLTVDDLRSLSGSIGVELDDLLPDGFVVADGATRPTTCRIEDLPQPR